MIASATDVLDVIQTAATVVGAIAAVVVGWIAVKVQRQLAEQSANQNAAINGAISAITWRSEIYALHDRGLTPEEIRYVMSCEEEYEGYERCNGLIDEVLRNVPRVTPVGLQPAAAEDTRRTVERPSGRKRAND